jgi:hypothetical protein
MLYAYKMKANNGKGNNAQRDEWITPSWIFDNLNESGIIDNEYITEVNNRLKGNQEPTEAEAPATPTAPQQDFLQFIRE